MPAKKVFFSIFLFLFFLTPLYAGQLVSKEAEKYYQEGVRAQKASKFFAADELYQKALLLDPYNSELEKYITNNRAIISAKQGDLDTAEAIFKEMLKTDPDYKPAAVNLGFIYETKRTRLESLEYWAKVFDWDNLKPKDYVIDEGPQELAKSK